MLVRNPGSFRDPSGHIYEDQERVFRAVYEPGAKAFAAYRDSGLKDHLEKRGLVVSSEDVPAASWPDALKASSMVLEHARIPYISFPYEWSFHQLKAAALHHLTVQIEALDFDFVLSDASAYNIQFVGCRPVFIDVLSFRPYQDRENWSAQRQFNEMFLNPLLLRRYCGIHAADWYRGRLEGISTLDTARLLPFRKYFNWRLLTQVVLLANFERAAIEKPDKVRDMASRKRGLPKSHYRAILQQLRKWVGSLEPKGRQASVWGEYADNNTYDDAAQAAKADYVQAFAAKVRPKLMFDIGCNTGAYSKLALSAGAERVIGFDFDELAVDHAFQGAGDVADRFLPLKQDLVNLSPDQGWRQDERPGFLKRSKADALVALALIHHLAIAKNIPLDQAIDFLLAVAPCGVIEFVPKQDPTVQIMLALREDIFPDYTEETFARLLSDRATVSDITKIPHSDRVLYTYQTNESMVNS